MTMYEDKILEKPKSPHRAAHELGELVERWFGREAGHIITDTLSSIIDDSGKFEDPHEWWGLFGEDPDHPAGYQ